MPLRECKGLLFVPVWHPGATHLFNLTLHKSASDLCKVKTYGCDKDSIICTEHMENYVIIVERGVLRLDVMAACW